MPPVAAHTHAFSRHVLVGFEPVVPHIRYPVTLGLYQEGNNLGLFLAPADLALIRQLTGIPDGDQALVMEGAAILDGAFLQARPEPRIVSWSELDSLRGEPDVIHIPASRVVDLDQIDIPTPILAAPEHAVPAELGSRVAIGLYDGCHAAIISPDVALISDVLTGFITAYASAAALRPCPRLAPELVAPLLQPMAPGEWRELRLIPRRRIFAIEMAPMGDRARATRWVCRGEGHSWLEGWSW
jgi:hypothetical protein